MMGFSMAASLGSHIVLRGTCETRIKCQLFRRTEQNSVGFKFSKHKAIPTAIFLCKQESTELDERKSPNEVREEIKQCYELIKRLGRGVVYLGSSRMGPSHSHHVQAQELAKEIANLLDCTSWSGAGPGLMDAVTQGALLAGRPVGGFKIGKEAGEWTASNFHPYLPSENYLTCRFFSARKHGLVDAVVRNNAFDKTAVVALPGGIGTLDEVFEILALIQLERIGSKLPVPFVLMNYDSFYSKLLDFLNVCEDWGTVSKGEVASLWKVCNSNSEALAYLADFYCISSSDTSKNVTKLYSTHESPS
ncbi:probable cytokinin riboside 5'-monophosphate phosphoribohydrolase LOGL10 [Gastrolobium bilobum]|uniref:probable cytokinin riboside 5'-monophosphate phosphoribohydrolase LOGL10 n=1 Tax=Gastrolobium bilobum TaxID=150636 RepID=UPI002AAFDDE0|nr:probable cytokinin riboside 5'-monophosphate phosphoribohydrolase LOGL10 [Gastrolobium bilobum]